MEISYYVCESLFGFFYYILNHYTMIRYLITQATIDRFPVHKHSFILFPPPSHCKQNSALFAHAYVNDEEQKTNIFDKENK